MNFCFEGFHSALTITASVSPRKTNKASIQSSTSPSLFFTEDLTEDHEVSWFNHTGLKYRDQSALSVILRFQFKIFIRNELHWKKLDKAELTSVIKWVTVKLDATKE